MRPANFVLDYSHPLARGLVFAGLGNAAGSSRCFDSSATKWHSPITSCSWSYENGRPCLLVTDPGSYVRLTSNVTGTPFDFTTDMTAAIWCRIISYDQYVGVWCNDDPGSDWGLQIRTDTLVSFRRPGSAGDDVTVPSTIDNEWHFFCGTYDGQSVVAHWDNLIGSGNAFSTDITPTATQRLEFGGTSSRTRYLTGAVADAMLWDRVLTPAEIRQLANPANTMLSGLIREPGKIGDIHNIEGVR